MLFSIAENDDKVQMAQNSNEYYFGVAIAGLHVES